MKYFLLFATIVCGNLATNEVDQTSIEDVLEASMVAAHIGLTGNNIPYQHESDQRVELDIVLTGEQMKDMDSGEPEKRNAIRNERYRWKNNIVPYEISNIFSENEKDVILRSIKRWQDSTCIEFVPKSAGTQKYVDISKGRGGCYSFVGSVGGGQELGLGRGCVSERIVIHELGHALGLFHHQSRPDRDMFVEIITENIRSGLERQFRKYPLSFVNTFETKYDYRSVMHYGQSFFTKNGMITIKTKDPTYQTIIGRAPRMSFVDVKTVNAMYKCGEKGECHTSSCPGEGFRGADCRCYCSENDGIDIVQCQQTESSSTVPTTETTRVTSTDQTTTETTEEITTPTTTRIPSPTVSTENTTPSPTGTTPPSPTGTTPPSPTGTTPPSTTPRPVKPRAETVIQKCDSWRNAYAECEIANATHVTSVDISSVRGGVCVYNNSFGSVDNRIWVNSGCRAYFNVSYERPDNGRCIDTVKQTCQSFDNTYAECEIPKAERVTYVSVNNILSGECIYNTSYGFFDNLIWVNAGCQATFIACFEPIRTGPCNETVNQRCESWDYAYAECKVSNASRLTYVAKTVVEGGICSFNYSYGIVENRIWVNHGCRAYFDICYEPSVDEPCFEKVTRVCASWRHAYDECEIANATHVTSVDISSVKRGECIKGNSYGSIDNKIWVNNGCQAYFDVCYQRPSNGRCIDTVKQTCESVNSSYTECEISIADRLTFLHVSSVLDGECTYNDSYGIVDNRIWVDHGCRANFLACFEPLSIGPCTENVTQRCESWDYAYAECEVSNALRVTYIAKKIVEGGVCNFNNSYGMVDGKIWVNHGCRAYFDVCYVPAASCKNIWKTTRCSKQKKKGKCTKSPKVRQNCKLTCDNCQAPDTDDCTNTWTDCNQWIRYCNTWKRLKSTCRRTCRRC